MNYIKQLEADKQDLENKNHELQAVLSEMYMYLTSPKFQQHEGCKELMNYVNTGDILARIMPVMKYTEDRRGVLGMEPN